MILLDFVCVQLVVREMRQREMAGHSGESTQYSPSTLSHLWTRLNIGGKYSTILDQYTVLYSTELYSWRKLSLKRREELFI